LGIFRRRVAIPWALSVVNRTPEPLQLVGQAARDLRRLLYPVLAGQAQQERAGGALQLRWCGFNAARVARLAAAVVPRICRAIGIGGPGNPAAPPTPPGMRVRTGRFERLRS
jgi:hypothetical protein